MNFKKEKLLRFLELNYQEIFILVYHKILTTSIFVSNPPVDE